jgi:acetoacetyl-CoA synthetase
MFGTSAKWLSLMEDKKIYPKETHKLNNLKIIYSTGSPLKPSSYDYVYSHVKNDILLCSITGKNCKKTLFH